jgi:hypothetical protein
MRVLGFALNEVSELWNDDPSFEEGKVVFPPSLFLFKSHNCAFRFSFCFVYNMSEKQVVNHPNNPKVIGPYRSVSRAQLLSNEPNEPNFSYYLSLLLQIIKQ